MALMATEILRPNAAGDSTEFTVTGATYNWQAVDEATPDDDVTYVGYALYSKKDLYNIQDSGIDDGDTINKVTLYARVKKPTSTYYKGYYGLKSGATEDWGTEITFTASYVDYSREYTTDPNTGSAWTKAALNALQIGERILDGANSGMRCTQIYVEVDYTAVTEKSSSDTGIGSESAPVASATLAGSESGQGQGAISLQLVAIIAAESGISVEFAGLLKDLFASELGHGSDSFAAKIESPTRGGGMKLWI